MMFSVESEYLILSKQEPTSLITLKACNYQAPLQSVSVFMFSRLTVGDNHHSCI